MLEKKVILDLCAGTGSWSAPYADNPEYAVVLVTLPLVDVREVAANLGSVFPWEEYGPVHGILAAPPCDHFSVSGAQYWELKDKDGRTEEALSIVDACLDIIEHYNPVWWALENPVGRLRRMRKERLGEPKLIFNPCDYGDPWTKKTLLWGRFREPAKSYVKPERVCAQGSWVQKLGGKSEKTKRLRSITPPGFARAFFLANP